VRGRLDTRRYYPLSTSGSSLTADKHGVGRNSERQSKVMTLPNRFASANRSNGFVQFLERNKLAQKLIDGKFAPLVEGNVAWYVTCRNTGAQVTSFQRCAPRRPTELREKRFDVRDAGRLAVTVVLRAWSYRMLIAKREPNSPSPTQNQRRRRSSHEPLW